MPIIVCFLRQVATSSKPGHEPCCFILELSHHHVSGTPSSTAYLRQTGAHLPRRPPSATTCLSRKRVRGGKLVSLIMRRTHRYHHDRCADAAWNRETGSLTYPVGCWVELPGSWLVLSLSAALCSWCSCVVVSGFRNPAAALIIHLVGFLPTRIRSLGSHASKQHGLPGLPVSEGQMRQTLAVLGVLEVESRVRQPRKLARDYMVGFGYRR